MAQFDFLKGDDLVVKLDGETLGGVKKAVCTVENKISDIMEFLTDVPVESFIESCYGIQLEMHTNNAELFDGKEKFNSIEFADRLKSVKYSDCRIKQVQTEILPQGNIEYRIKITANNREVYDVDNG